jgi:hypothetical protein
MQINDGLFHTRLAELERCPWMLRADASWGDPDDFARTCRRQALIGLMAVLGSTFLGLTAVGLGG